MLKQRIAVCFVLVVAGCSGSSGRVVQCTTANNFCADGGADSGVRADSGVADAGIAADAGPCPGCPASFAAPSSGGSYAATVQTGGNFTNVGILGEPTPGNAGGSVSQTGGTYQNQGGFNSTSPP